MDTLKSHQRFVVRAYWYALILLFLATLLAPKVGLILWINQTHTTFQDGFWKVITFLGEGWIFIPVLIFTLFVRFRLSLAIVFIALAHGVVCLILKRTLFAGEMRPTAVIGQDHLYLVPDVTFHAHHSFPSGHTATIFCFAVYVSLLIRNKIVSILLLVMALLVGYSRLYLLQHFLPDVTGGALIGSVTAFLVAYIFDRNNFPTWTNSRLIVRPPRALRRGQQVMPSRVN